MKTIEVLSKSGGFNKCIGGSFSFWHRGSSFTGLTGSAGTKIADRFIAGHNLATGVFDVNLSIDTPNYATANSVKFDVTTAQASIGAAEYAVLSHRFEGNVIKELYGKSIVVSFWVKSNLTGIYTVGVRNAPHYTRSYHSEYTIYAADTWEQKYIVIPHEFVGTWEIGTDIGMDMLFSVATGSNYHDTPDQWNASTAFSTSNQVNLFASTSNYIQFAQIMAHEGRGLTDSFVYSGGDLLGELKKLYRFYETGAVITENYALGGSGPSIMVFYESTKRVLPSVTLTHIAGSNVNGIPVIGGGLQNTKEFAISEILSTTNQFYYQVNWTSDAEF